MTGYEIASGAVGRDGARVGGHSEEYDAALKLLKSRGDGSSSWGDDGLFTIITNIYSECAQVGIAAFDQVTGEIGGTGEGLQAVSRQARDVEDANTANVEASTWA